MDIKLVYAETTPQLLQDSLLVEAFYDNNMRDTKVKALNRLGIEVADDEEPMIAWARHLHEINGLPYTPGQMWHEDLRNPINDPLQYNREFMAFLFWLA